MIDNDTNHLHPVVQPYIPQLQLRVYQELGIMTDVRDTYRGAKAQTEALASGHSRVGFGDSWHNVQYPSGKPCAFAFHLHPKLPGKRLIGFGDSLMHPKGARTVPIFLHTRCTAAPEEFAAPALIYIAMGLIGEELGLTWGGRWHDPMDWAHFELHPDGATLSQVKAIIQSQGDIPAARTA